MADQLNGSMSRRGFVSSGSAAITAVGLGLPASASADAALKKVIPSSGEMIPVMGMGTSRTFNIGHDPEALLRRVEILKRFFSAGGGMIDSSPMYGSSEAVIGRAMAKLGDQSTMFSASKIWTSSITEGPTQLTESMRLWGGRKFDLMQVHNLRAWRGHLRNLQREKDRGRVRYIGITTSHGRRHDEFLEIMKSRDLDFVQFSYNPLDREAEQRLLPLAQDRGMAVIINRPFRRGELPRLAEGAPLPGFARDIGCRTWAQLMLKFSASHPAVTCVIPATTNPDHMDENMAVAMGPMPDKPLRETISKAVAAL